MGLRAFLDDIEPHFSKDGKFSYLFPLYEAIDTALYTPGKVTGGPSHVRDGLDLKRIMMTVWLLAVAVGLVGSYFVGYHANLAMEASGIDSVSNWRGLYLNLLVSYDPDSFWDCVVHGIGYLLPLYVVVFAAGILFEVVFASKRGHEVNEGFFVTSILYTLTLPPDIPLHWAIIGIIFGVVLGKEVFGGTGKNFLNPALTGRAFLYFAYPVHWSGDSVWVAVDGYSSPTILGIGAQEGLEGIQMQYSWLDSFLGNIPGSIGETSTLFILLGLLILLYTRVASWRIVAGVLLGTLLTSLLFNLIGSDSNPMFSLPFHWHLVIGGFAFGLAFMAVEPVSGSHTNLGRWYYGILIGIMVVLIRVVNPAYPEGMMLAILFANLFAPLIDHFVQERNIKQRLKAAK